MLTEKYRPKIWKDVVGQDKVLQRIELLRARGLAGRAYSLIGASGTGKTTIARLLASEVADDFAIEEIDAGSCTVAALREIEGNWMLSGFGAKCGRAYIVNESHGLRKDAIRQLLVMLERIPKHVIVLFTTTNDGEELLFEDNTDAAPFLSRCIQLSLARRDIAKPFAERAQLIAEMENLGSAPLASILKLVQTHRNNFRAVLQAIESGALLA